ncbi:ATP-binding protein [Corynebacterium cystitidis]|uniref:ATP-binding protein n=1 Tax=Corynebacterium cystitidis TaxID=35757 RepID=UPI00211EE6CB|nr:DUF4143 domain-containing protein [Corynebacterium cystitidis]
MTKIPYIPRIADSFLESGLRRAGAVLIEGPKGCGKTETARQAAASEVQVDIDPEVSISMEIDPRLVLQGEMPRLLDEWQVHPQLWNVVRHEVDDRQAPGQFILTGSTASSEGASRHSGAGRFARLTMHTMTLSESGESNGNASLRGIAAGETPALGSSSLTLEELVARICRGGWPGYAQFSDSDVHTNLRDYVDTVAHVDISTPDDVRRDPVRVRRVLQSLALGVGTELSIASIAVDTGLARETVMDYLDSLQHIFISQDQPAWAASLRSRTPLRKAPKRHLADPALAVAALNKTPADLLRDLEYLGQLFESLVVHELRALTGQPVYHARTATGDEVDAIVEVDGHTVFVEVKLGHRKEVVDRAASSLLKFADSLSEPATLLVITGGGLSYRRPDGVNVVAIGELGP